MKQFKALTDLFRGMCNLQYWYYQYFPESSSICNTGITSISQNLPVSTILIFWQWPVSSSIADTGKFWKILGN
jgi:hypothetical protein